MSFSFGLDPTYTMAAFGAPSSTTVNYLIEHAKAAYQTLGEIGAEASKAIIGTINKFTSADYLAKAHRLATEMGHATVPMIRELSSVSDFRTIDPLMAQYVVCSPTFRKMYAEGMTAGYCDHVEGDQFVPLVHIPDPLAPISTLEPYRRVMSGSYLTDEHGNENLMFFSSDNDGVEELKIPEKFSIRNTYDNADLLCGTVEDLFSLRG